MGKFKAVYDEALVPTRLRRKSDHTSVVLLLATFDDAAWVLSEDAEDNLPWTTKLEYWEPVPELTPSDALPGDEWTYGDFSFSSRYRVLGVDLKAGVWHIVNSENFGEYKTKDQVRIQDDTGDLTVYTRSLPDEGSVRSMWKLVHRP